MRRIRQASAACRTIKLAGFSTGCLITARSRSFIIAISGEPAICWCGTTARLSTEHFDFLTAAAAIAVPDHGQRRRAVLSKLIQLFERTTNMQATFHFISLAATLCATCAVSGSAARVPDATHQAHRALCRRRQRGHFIAHTRGPVDPDTRSTDRGRQSYGRGRQHRWKHGRQSGAGRLHAIRGLERVADGQPRGVFQSSLRLAARFCADQHDQHYADGSRCASFTSREFYQGSCRARARSPAK